MSRVVTVITVTHNRARILPMSVDSVLSQDYPDLRLLIVDDGSTDGTAELLDRYRGDARVTVVRHDTNRGVTAARNTALDLLDGEVDYFGYNDSDDMLLPGAIRTAVEAIEAHGTRYSMVSGVAVDAASGKRQGRLLTRSGEIRPGGEVTFDDSAGRRIRGDSFILLRRDLLGSMRHEPRANGGEGTLWARFLRLRPGLWIEDVLQAKDRSGSDRVTHYRLDQAYSEGRMWLLLEKLRYCGDAIQRRYPQLHAELLRKLAHHAAMAGHAPLARWTSRQAMRASPSLRTALTMGVALAPAPVAREITRLAQIARSQMLEPDG